MLRHLAIATIHAVSGGRATLGIGRGDSALAHLGHAPASPDILARYLEQLQGYLRGDEVPFERRRRPHRLGLAQQPAGSRIQWLRPGRYSKVPSTWRRRAPRSFSHRRAPRRSDHLRGGRRSRPPALGRRPARSARAAAGQDPGALGFGAYVNVVVHDDPEQARQLGEAGLSLFARFGAMHARLRGRPPRPSGGSCRASTTPTT